MAVISLSRTLRDAPNGNPTGTQAPAGEKCSIMDQSPAKPAAPLWLQISLDNQPNKPVGWITAAAVDTSGDGTVGPIDKNVFADTCVTFEQIFEDISVSSLYLMAVAELRTRIIAPPLSAAPDARTLHGPFALTANDWDFGLSVPGFNFTYKPSGQGSDIDNWPAQINVVGAMTQLAQAKITALRGETPSFIGLYLSQIVGSSIANTLLSDPTQKASALVAAANPTDLLKEGVDKASVLTRYGSVLGADIAAVITSSLAISMQQAIDAIQSLIVQAGGMVTSSATVPIVSPGTVAKINLLSPKIPATRRPNATLIVQKFQQAGFGPNQQVAALAAAIHESRLDEKSDVSDPDAEGHPGRAYGLFQCRIPGVGSGHDPNILKTADGNISTAIDYIKSSAQKARFQKFAKASDVQTAITEFIDKFEQPADKPGEIADCIKIANSVTS